MDFVHKMLLPVLVFVAFPFAIACGDDDDGSGEGENPCEKATTVRTGAISDYCADKTDHCCYCQCWETSNGLYDTELFSTQGTCECQEMPASQDTECEDATLDFANTCLENESTCAQGTVSTAEIICDSTVL